MRNLRFYTIVVLLSIASAGLLSYGSIRVIQAGYRELFPDVAILKSQYPVAIGKEGKQIVYKFQRRRPAYWVNLRELPKQVTAAILMSEDGTFFQHGGYSPEAIRAAIEHNQKPGVKIKRGGSTITQQVVKNLFLSPEKTLSRKLRELLLAVEVERRFPKTKILETYLNIAEWGPGVYGIQRASLRYFRKTAANLSAREAATLAFMLPNPTKYQNSFRDGELSAFGTKRVEAILERMWRTGKISDEEYTSAGVGNGDELPSNL